MVFRTALIFISQSATVLRKNCLCKHFLTKYRPGGKKRTWFVTQIQIITKKSSTYNQGTIVVFHTTLIFITQSATVLRKNCLCKHFLQNIVLGAKKRTWLVTQIHIITKKSSTYTQGDYSGLFRTALIFISQSATVLRKNCLCKHFLTKYRPGGKKRTWLVTQIHDYN